MRVMPGRFTAIAGCSLLVVCLPMLVLGELPGERWLAASGENSLAYGLIGAGLLIADVVLPVPSSVVGTMLGAQFGFAGGFVWAWTGLAIGNLAGYAIGVLWPARFSIRFAPAPGLLFVFASRAVPVLAETVALCAGATRMGLPAFAIVSAAGSGLYAAALAGCGSAVVPQSWAGPVLVAAMFLPALAWSIGQLSALAARTLWAHRR